MLSYIFLHFPFVPEVGVLPKGTNLPLSKSVRYVRKRLLNSLCDTVHDILSTMYSEILSLHLISSLFKCVHLHAKYLT